MFHEFADFSWTQNEIFLSRFSQGVIVGPVESLGDDGGLHLLIRQLLGGVGPSVATKGIINQ